MNPQCTNQDQPHGCVCVCFLFFSTILFFFEVTNMTKRIAMTICIKMERELDDIVYSRKNASTIKNFTTFATICHMISCEW